MTQQPVTTILAPGRYSPLAFETTASNIANSCAVAMVVER
jgi:hypothetical protein